MKAIAIAAALVSMTAAVAHAQSTVPDLRGTWTGKGKSVVFGNHPHHPGQQAVTDPPRVQDLEVTYVVEGQDGRVAWGRSRTNVVDSQEPFAWAISGDNKTILGADTDGYFLITVMGRNRLEKCYAHAGVSPTKSIVAACHTMERKR